MAVAGVTAKPRLINPWIVALAVIIPTFMEVLDTTIANVALRYMAGGLSAPSTDSEWVITSYLAANAIILPMSGWLSVRLGRRRYFLISIAVFTFASAMCGMALNLEMLIASRVLQGLAGGGLQPSSQGVLLDAFPPEKQGAAQTLFGIAALLAPVVGPTLGGYITDNYGWRWIFYINIPVGLFALWFCRKVVIDPDYLKSQQTAMRKKRAPFDTLGLCLLCLTMISWEIVLSKGQEWDWLGDPFYRVHLLLILFLAGLLTLVWRELRISNPLINFRTLADRNFRWSCTIIFCAFGVLYANTTTLPDVATIALWLRCHHFRISPLTSGPFRHHGPDIRRNFDITGRRCALFHSRGLDHDGHWQLLDVTVDARNQPLASGLAACCRHRGTLHGLRAAECGRFSLHPEGTAWRCGRAARPAAQRRRQCRYVDRKNHSRAARPVPLSASRRISRLAESGREFFF